MIVQSVPRVGRLSTYEVTGPYRMSGHHYRLACSYKILYIDAMDDAKDIDFVDTALDDLRTFPNEARRDAGYQLDKVQHGEEPDDWKPFPAVGPGTREIRIAEDNGAFRVMYVVKFDEKIHVLHCFQKKTQATARKDVDLAKKRYASLKREFGK